jgi:DNA-directed RNA polymerase II subunit RPB1
MLAVYIDDVVIPNLLKIYVSGISGVLNAFFVQDEGTVDTWHLETEGGNFGEVLTHPHVDTENTMTNNIWDVYHILGIEAARQYIFEELVAIMPSISPFHSKFLVDYMTKTGTITSISRYTMRSEGSGALSKASFEETLDNLMNAGLAGEIENPSSVSTSIICGKLGSFGTGVCELKLDLSKLKKGLVMDNVMERSVV